MMLQQLVRVSMYAATALDRAAMAVAYGEEAAEHYREPYTLACGLRNWALGFREGWALARSRDIEVCDMARAAGVPVAKARTALAKSNSIDSKRELMVTLNEAIPGHTHQEKSVAAARMTGKPVAPTQSVLDEGRYTELEAMHLRENRGIQTQTAS